MIQLIPFGMRQGLIVHIGEVDRGLDCECVCPDCGSPLVARKGLVRQPHFAHYVGSAHTSCGGGYETVMHRYAKQVIADAGYIQLPSFAVTFSPPDDDLNIVIASRRATFQRIEVEERMAFARRRVDVVGYEKDRRILIEVCVTHRVRGRKLKEVRKASESMVEITLRDEVIFAERSDALRSAILDDIGNKRWIFHPDGHPMEQDVVRRARERAELRQLEARQRKHQAPQSSTEPPWASPTVARSRTGSSAGHVPSREGCSPEAYVQAIDQFLSAAGYDDKTQMQVVRALMISGNISAADQKLAREFGLRFARFADEIAM